MGNCITLEVEILLFLILTAAEQEEGFLRVEVGEEDWREGNDKPFAVKRLDFNGVLLEEKENMWLFFKTLEADEEIVPTASIRIAILVCEASKRV